MDTNAVIILLLIVAISLVGYNIVQVYAHEKKYHKESFEFFEITEEDLEPDSDFFEKLHQPSRSHELIQEEEAVESEEEAEKPRVHPRGYHSKSGELRKTHVHLTDEEKDELYTYYKNNPDLDKKDIMSHYDISRSALNRLIREKEGKK